MGFETWLPRPSSSCGPEELEEFCRSSPAVLAVLVVLIVRPFLIVFNHVLIVLNPVPLVFDDN